MHLLCSLIGRKCGTIRYGEEHESCQRLHVAVKSTHFVQAAKVLQLDNSMSLVTELAGSIVDKFVYLPKMSSHDKAAFTKLVAVWVS